MSFWGQILFQDAASSSMMELTKLHDHALMIMVLVVAIVSYTMTSLYLPGFKSRSFKSNDKLEVAWTVAPLILLVFLAMPSFTILYLMEETGSPSLSVKVIAHQWYWSYEYSDLSDISLDSFMTPEDELKMGDLRLLEVDNRMCLPANISTRLVVTSTDVIHSFAIPSFGIKIDAIPGRLNQITIQPNRYGVFYGMCSEICGANHAFMPIVVEVIPAETLKNWVKAFQEN